VRECVGVHGMVIGRSEIRERESRAHVWSASWVIFLGNLRTESSSNLGGGPVQRSLLPSSRARSRAILLKTHDKRQEEDNPIVRKNLGQRQRAWPLG
jgi:hypothetical protein